MVKRTLTAALTTVALAATIAPASASTHHRTGGLANGDRLPHSTATRIYSTWGEDLAGPARDAHRHGQLPILSVKDSTRDAKWIGPSWAQVCAGKGAGYWKAQSSRLGKLGFTVWLTFDHEPNATIGKNRSLTPGQFACAFRKVQSWVHARNVRWYSALTLAAYLPGQTPAAYYVGAHLDAVGMDGYSWGAMNSGPRACFEGIMLAGARRVAAARHIPVVVPEWGVSQTGITDRDRATCITRFYSWTRSSPFVIYYSTSHPAYILNVRLQPGTQAWAAYVRATR